MLHNSTLFFGGFISLALSFVSSLPILAQEQLGGAKDICSHSDMRQLINQKNGPILCLTSNDTSGERTIDVEVVVDSLYLFEDSAHTSTSRYTKEIRAELLQQTEQTVDQLNQHFSFLGIRFQEHSYKQFTERVGAAGFERKDTIHILYRPELILLIGSCGALNFSPQRGEHYIYINLSTPGCNDYSISEGTESQGLFGTLIHEMGHYFGLFHTHHLHNTDYAEPVSRNSLYGTRRKCEVWGDFFCDTPADFDLGGHVDAQSCEYTGDFKDAYGDPYEPDLGNFMSYTPAKCRRSFSEEQSKFMTSFINDVLLCENNGFAPLPVQQSSALAYPNPFHDSVRILLRDRSAVVRIYDLSGRLIREIQNTLFEQDHSYGTVVVWDGLDSGGLPVPRGTYIVAPVLKEIPYDPSGKRSYAYKVIKR